MCQFLSPVWRFRIFYFIVVNYPANFDRGTCTVTKEPVEVTISLLSVPRANVINGQSVRFSLKCSDFCG